MFHLFMKTKRFSNWTIATKNINQHVVHVHDGMKPFKCDYKCFMNKHVACVHEVKKPLKCELCKCHCFNKRNLNRHVTSLHEGKKPFKCTM